MKTLISAMTIAALAACGSKSAPKPTTPEPDHDHEHAGAGSAIETPDTTSSQTNPATPTTPTKPDPNAELIAAEKSAWDTAKPVFDKACATCHTSAGKKAAKKKLDHFNFDAYPPGGHHAGTIGFTIRDVLGISGKKPTMPDGKPGSVKGDDLAKIKAWTDAWEAAEKAGAHPHVNAEPDEDKD